MTAPTSTRGGSPVPISETRPVSRAETDIVHSDPENDTEKPVREKLREATITGEARNRLQKKRSFEGDDDGDQDEQKQESSRHVRKKSREAENTDEGAGLNGNNAVRVSTPDSTNDPMDEEASENLTSPKNKRARDELQQEKVERKEVISAETATEIGTPSDTRKTKRPRASPPLTNEAALDATTAALPASSGFANTSTTSPFGAAGSKSPLSTSSANLISQPQTSESTFKNSGFGAFANTSASPFGSSTSGAKSAFASSSGSASPWATKPLTPATQPSAFAAAAPLEVPKSGFGNTSSTSGFGALKTSASGGFGSTSGFGGFGGAGIASKTSVFASGLGSKIEGISQKPARAFGASEDTEEESEGTDADGAEEGVKIPAYENDVKKDKRFYEQNIETGEEGETTMFSERAKIYEFNKNESKWVERGMGNFKFNISYTPLTTREGAEEGKQKLMDAPADDEEVEAGQGAENGTPTVSKTTARFIMRANGSQRVILNTKVSPTMLFGDAEGKEPTGMAILFNGYIVDGESKELKFAALQLRMKAENSKALWLAVKEAQKDL